MDANLDKILRKLRKLKALYHGAKAINSEGEANNAAAAIQRLLTSYNLTMEEIGEEVDKDVVLEERTSGYTYKSIGGDWEHRLTVVLCKWNFCKCFTIGSSYREMVIFGKKENIETVKWLRELLSEKFVAFSKKRYKEYKLSPSYRSISVDAYQRRYLLGCAAGLNEKFAEEAARDKQEDVVMGTKITALVVRNFAAIDEYVATKYKQGAGKKTTTKVDNCYAFGFKDGKNTDIHKGVGDSKRDQANGVKFLG